MNQQTLRQCGHLEDRALLAALRGLLAQQRRMTAELVVHMSEVDARGLYRGEGFSSMFGYCTEALHMSEDEAYSRIRVARVVRDYPAAVGALAEGRLHLTALTLLASAPACACACGTRMRTGGRSPSPDRYAWPLAAITVRSVASHCAFGPSPPKGVIETYTSAGFSAERSA